MPEDLTEAAACVAGAFLDGVNMGSLALKAEVTWQLGRASLIDAATLCLAVVSAAAVLRWRVNSVWLILGGAVMGPLTRAIHHGF